MSTIFPGSASVGQVYNNYTFDGTAWNINGIDLTENYLEESSASATYLTKVSASNTYITQTSASTTYQPKVANVSDTEIGYLDGVTSAIQTQINAKANLSGATFTGDITTTKLTATSPGGDEGGEINLAKAVTNTTLNTGVVVDVNQNRLRIFEQGSPNRGGYIDLATLPNGVSTNLVPGLVQIIPTSISVSSGSGTVSSGGAITFSGTTSILINNCFSSNYDNYKITISNLTASSGQLLSYQMSSSGSAVGTSTYSHQRNYTQGTTTGGERTGPTTSSSLSYIGTGALNYVSAEVMNPFLSTITKTISHGNYSDPSFPYYIDIFNGYHSTAASYDGIRIFSAATISGTIRIYGYNNG